MPLSRPGTSSPLDQAVHSATQIPSSTTGLANVTPMIGGISVLNLEDNVRDAELTIELISGHLPGCQIKVVGNRHDFLAELQRPGATYDIILSDFTLPSFDGFEAFELARKLVPDSIFIFYSGTIPDATALQAMRLGATDYVSKDRPIRLVTAIERARRERVLSRSRAEAEEELRRSEERYRILVEQASDALYVHDADGRFCEVNRLATTGLGYTRDELLAMSVWDVEAQLGPDALKTQWAELKPNAPVTFQGRHRRKDGVTFPVEIRLARFDIDGEPRFLALVRDISERVAAEARIREQNEMLNKANDAIFAVDMRNRVLFWSRGAERVFGCTITEAMGGVIGLLIGMADQNRLADARRGVLEHGEWAGEMKGKNRHGQDYHVEMSLSLVRNDAEQPYAIIAIGSDVTEKEKLREQFHRMQRLEGVGALATGIAHDLNNILAPIILAVPMLQTNAKRPQDLRLLKMVETSAARGSALVRQVLGFTHGSGNEQSAIQIRHLLSDMVNLIKATFPKTVRLDLPSPSGLWPVQGNATQIYQVLMNLCVNARDAMTAGGGTLRLHAGNITLDETAASCINGARPGDWVLISIADTGCGIPPEQIPLIWEPFYTTKKESGGTGLGLATVRDIVHSHAGFMTLQSELGGGSTFSVYLPAIKQTEGVLTEETVAPTARGDGELILVVEDETIVRSVIVAILSRHGYEVIEAKDGLAGLEAFMSRSSEVQLIVTDVDMPRLDGLALGRMIRKLSPQLSILTLSGSDKALAGLINAGGAAGTLLLKPFTTDVLLRKVGELLGKL